MPPVFIALGAKDRPDISLGMAQLYLKYKEAGVPAELHIYANADMASATDRNPNRPMGLGPYDCASGWSIAS